MAGTMFEKDETVVSRAILGNDLENLKFALQEEDVHYKDRKGNTYLHYLCTMNRPYLIHVLIGTGIDLNAVNRHGNSALHVTALQGECCHVSDLMAAGIDASIKNKNGQTAAEIVTKNLFWKQIYNKYEPGVFEAIAQHDVDKLIHLLHCWSRVDTTRDGLTLRQFAACRKFHDMVYHIDMHQHTLQAIYSVMEGNAEKAQPFLTHKKCNVNLINKAADGKHILQEAIKLSNIKLVRMICRSKVDVNIRIRLKNFIKAPLYFSVLHPCVSNDMLWTVLQSGCDFRLRDERGRNAAVFALDRWKGSVPLDVIAFMLKQQLDVAHRDATGITLRDVAQFYRRKDILNLIDKAFVKVIRSSNIPELERLCTQGYDGILIKFNYKDTFIYASGNESEDVLNFIQWIPKFQTQVWSLFHSIRCQSLDAVTNIINNCQRPDLLIRAKDKGGRSAIHVAILHWRFDVLKLLLSLPHVCLDMQDNCGRTALHYACSVEEEDEREQFCTMLLQGGIGQLIPDFTDHMAADYKESVNAHKWLARERKVVYGLSKQLACIDKYEELNRMMKGKGKNVKHFNELVKNFKHPVPQFYSILSPVIPNYRDLLHVAIDYAKEDIAIKLVQLGNSVSVCAEVKVEMMLEKGTVEVVRKRLSVMDRAKQAGMAGLVIAIEKQMAYQRGKAKAEIVEQKGGDECVCISDRGDKKYLNKVRKLNNVEYEEENVVFDEEEVDELNSDDDMENVALEKDRESVDLEFIDGFYSDNFDDVSADNESEDEGEDDMNGEKDIVHR